MLDVENLNWASIIVFGQSISENHINLQYVLILTCSKLVALSKYVTLILAPAGECDLSTRISSVNLIHQSSFCAGELKILMEYEF